MLTASDFLVLNLDLALPNGGEGQARLPAWNSDMINMERISSGKIFRALESLELSDPALDSPATLSRKTLGESIFT